MRLIKINSKSLKSSSFEIERQKDDIYQIEGKILCYKKDAQGIFLIFESQDYWPFLYFKLSPFEGNNLGLYVLNIGYHSKEKNEWIVLDKVLNVDILENNSYKIQISKDSIYLKFNDKDIGRLDFDGMSFPEVFHIKNIQDDNSQGIKEEVTLNTYIVSVINSKDIKVKNMPNVFDSPLEEKNPVKICALICSKDGEHTLSTCLKCIEDQVDYFVLLNNSSNDNTKNIMLEFKEKHPEIVEVIDFHTDFFDESLIRNKSVEVGQKFNPDWFMVVDDDEMLEENFREKIEERLHDETVNYISFNFDYCFSQTKYRYRSLDRVERMFRNKKDQDLSLKSKRLHISVIPDSIRNSSIMFNSKVRVKHLTFYNFEDLRNKYISYRKNDILNEGKQSYSHFVKYMMNYKEHGISYFFKEKLDYNCKVEILS